MKIENKNEDEKNDCKSETWRCSRKGKHKFNDNTIKRDGEMMLCTVLNHRKS